MWNASPDTKRLGRGPSSGVALAALTVLVGVGACATSADPNAPPDAAQVARGAEVYEQVCSECHDLQPPPDVAPPMTHVARHVKQSVDDRRAFTEHVVNWIPAPDEERSLLPERAIRRFGLMPAQRLPEDQLADVAAWLWVMADSAQMGMEGGMDEGGMHEGGMRGRMGEGGMGEGGMRGRMGEGGMRGRNMPPDTAR